MTDLKHLSTTHLETIPFETFIETALAGLQSDASRRQYRYTYIAWATWCDDHQLAPIHMNITNVTKHLQRFGDFLIDMDTLPDLPPLEPISLTSTD
ncbi:MAG: hypothetical protein AAF846_23410 [Chloroflexota bacterium]